MLLGGVSNKCERVKFAKIADSNVSNISNVSNVSNVSVLNFQYLVVFRFSNAEMFPLLQIFPDLILS